MTAPLVNPETRDPRVWTSTPRRSKKDASSAKPDRPAPPVPMGLPARMVRPATTVKLERQGKAGNLDRKDPRARPVLLEIRAPTARPEKKELMDSAPRRCQGPRGPSDRKALLDPLVRLEPRRLLDPPGLPVPLARSVLLERGQAGAPGTDAAYCPCPGRTSQVAAQGSQQSQSNYGGESPGISPTASTAAPAASTAAPAQVAPAAAQGGYRRRVAAKVARHA
ncbi:hypothetical protein M3Y99_01779800 [Aphelenchoides fujianensis]|nr:hypothetical protein M3Y99_01779800 [Aphelenchoides fujianensis]